MDIQSICLALAIDWIFMLNIIIGNTNDLYKQKWTGGEKENGKQKDYSWKRSKS